MTHEMMHSAVSGRTRKPTGLGPLQRRRQLTFYAAGLAAAAALPFFESFWRDAEYSIHEGVELVGLALIGAGIIGRMWCTLYIGGRKSSEVVATGPYSISRNPLYFFTIIAMLGIGFLTGSVLLGVLLAAISWAILLPVVRREEALLAARFEEFDAYRLRVPRLWPDLRGWKDTETVIAKPRLIWRTLRDALPFFLALPYWEGVEWLHSTGHIVPLIRLP